VEETELYGMVDVIRQRRPMAEIQRTFFPVSFDPLGGARFHRVLGVRHAPTSFSDGVVKQLLADRDDRARARGAEGGAAQQHRVQVVTEIQQYTRRGVDHLHRSSKDDVGGITGHLEHTNATVDDLLTCRFIRWRHVDLIITTVIKLCLITSARYSQF